MKNKRTFTFVKNKGYIPASQLNRNENIHFETSTSTSTTIELIPVIEQRVLPV